MIAMALGICLLTGCGNPMDKMKETTVYVKKDGTVESVFVETFDKKYYDENELKTWIEKEIQEEQKERGEDSVQLKSFEVKEKKATLFLNYQSVEDYEQFTETELEAGDTTSASLLKKQKMVEANTKSEKAVTIGEEELDSLSYVKINDVEDTQILVDGTIRYYSKGMEFVDNNIVKVPAGMKGIILYEQ